MQPLSWKGAPIHYPVKTGCPLGANSMGINFCQGCGTKVSFAGNFCVNCGSPLNEGVQKSFNSRQAPRRTSQLDLFVEEAVKAARGRDGGKNTQIEYTSDEVRKSASGKYRENLSALIVALGLELKGGEL